MKRSIKIEPVDDNRNYPVYTIKFYNEDGTPEEQSETDKFLAKYRDTCPEELDKFVALLDLFQEEGIRRIKLRDERNPRCQSLFALLDEDAGGRKYRGGLRLYCLYYEKGKLILGNGSIKVTGAFQDDPNISLIVNELMQVHNELQKKLKTHEFWWAGSKLISRKELIIEIET